MSTGPRPSRSNGKRHNEAGKPRRRRQGLPDPVTITMPDRKACQPGKAALVGEFDMPACAASSERGCQRQRGPQRPDGCRKPSSPGHMSIHKGQNDGTSPAFHRMLQARDTFLGAMPL